MNGEERIPRSRGCVCGVLLILLGLWGGLAPFVGPYLHFGYTPDTAWAYNSGRLYYSIIPGAVALLAGVLITITRNRGVAIGSGALAALGGAWFVVGNGFVTDVLHRSISHGVPLLAGVSGANAVDLRSYLELVSLFTGLGVVIAVVGAIVIGRFSLVAAKDVVADDGYQPPYPMDSAETRPDLSQYPTTVSPSSSVPPFAPAPFPDTAQIPKSE
jgi:hypothetical protein